MANIGRFHWLRNRLPSVVGRRFCIGGGVAHHQYRLKPFLSHPRPSCLFISPYHAQSTLDDDEVEAYKKHLLQYLDPDSPLYDRYLQDYVKGMEIRGAPLPLSRDFEHVRSTPLLDLLSVTIHSTHNATSDVDYHDDSENDRRPHEVYGTIQLIDVENDCASNVYRRPCNKPETILPGYNLTLINSKGSYCSLLMPRAAAYKLRLNLKDAKFDAKVIAKGDFDLQLLSEHGKIMTQVVPGRNGFYASVQYATLPLAVVATVKLTLTKLDETGSHQSESSHASIYGCISASSKLQQGSVISSVLLHKPPSDPLMVNLGKPIKLSRDVLAVPAYSFLEIKADLWDHLTNQQIASDVTIANCDAQDKDMEVQKCILGQSYHVQVQICWNNAYEVLDKGRIPLDKTQILHGKRSYSTSSSRGSQASKGELLTSLPIPSFSGSPLVEVFSITVFPDCDVNSNISGKIGIYDDDNYKFNYPPYYLFRRDASNAVSLSRGMEIKSIEWPVSPFLGPGFSMFFRLFDDMGRVVSHGYFDWDRMADISWHGKLISSVIRGEDGYATVHYAIFPNAVQAKVGVEVIPDDPEIQCMVGGNISAWYSKLYSGCSEKTFCRNTLSGDDFHQSIVSGDNALKLQKSAVAVPLDSSLILGIKLQVGVIGETFESPLFPKHADVFDEVVDFKVDVGKLSLKSIPRKGYKVDVSVEWNKVDRSERLKCLRYLENCLRSSFQED